MGKITEWESQYEGADYRLSHEKVKGIHLLKVNGEAVEIKPSLKSSFLGFDEPFRFDGREARLVIENKEPDIVIDGKYLKSGKSYVAIPKWLIAFVIVLFPLLILGGAIGGALMAVGILFCRKISRQNKSNVMRLVSCAAISLGAWLIYFIIAAVIAG